MMIESTVTRCFRIILSLASIGIVHWAAIAWAMHAPTIYEEDSQTGGAFIIELDAITASPEDERRDIAVGVKSEEVAAIAPTTPQVASTATIKPLEDEPVVPEAKQPPPEDAVQKRPEEILEEIKPEESADAAAKEAPAVVPVNASTAAAPQMIDNAEQKSETPRGSNEGLTRLDRIAIENWQRDLVSFLNRYKRYPAQARQSRQFGVVSITFSMDRTGRVLRSGIAASSGHGLLDSAAIEMLNKAGSLPVPPASVPGDTIELIVPVKYRWRE